MPTLWTLGHSVLPWGDFAAVLRDAGIRAVADVRRFPGSRRHPQYSAEAMAQALPALGIRYAPMPALGGRRKARPDSPNTAWRTPGFRGYADYMDTPAYAAARDALADLALGTRTAMLCAESLWWQCHRSLVSDDFKARGWDVLHLAAGGRCTPHPYTAAARIEHGKLTYAAPDAGQGALF